MTKEDKFNSMFQELANDPEFIRLSLIAFNDPKTQEEHDLKMWALDEVKKMIDRKTN